jgi:hypothetical protein
MRTASHLPDWQRIGREPWARNVILGLAGYQDERRARTQLSALADQSVAVARAPVPLHVTGYYFPVEIDPTWQDAPKLAAILNRLPRPLWVSVYDQSNIGGKALADWLVTWLPADVGVLFQDGCGVYAREPYVARTYVDDLAARLGKRRAADRGGVPTRGAWWVRAATADELAAQLAVYRGYSVYLFDGPHYVSDALTREPRAAGWAASGRGGRGWAVRG